MSGKTDEVKGRVKEAAGALSDDDDLRDEGKADQLAGKAKDTADKVVDKVRDAAGKVSDKVKDAKERVRHTAD